MKTHDSRPRRRRFTGAPLRALLLAVVALLSLPGTVAADDWTVEDEFWYVIEIAGARAGWSHLVYEENGDLLRSHTMSKMSIGRGDQAIPIETDTVFTETRSGVPVSMTSIATMSQQPVTTAWKFAADGVTVTSIQGGQETVSTVDPPEGKWLTPRAATRYFEARRLAGADEVVYRVVIPEFGLAPAQVTSVRDGEAMFEFDGRTIPVSVWSSTNDVVNVPSTESYTSDGHLAISTMQLPMGEFTSRLVTEKEARTEGDGAPPELMFTMFIPVTGLNDSMNATSATLKLRVKEGTMPEFPEIGAQRVESGDADDEVVLHVDMHDNLPAPPEDLSNEEFTGVSIMVKHDDPLVTSLARKAVRGAGTDPMARAESMRDFVYKHISEKSLATAFATAAETARTRTGDCSEHGVLLAALLRANGIPSRVAMGLVYVEEFGEHEGIFGWHMWTQALIDGHWVDLDATLPVTYTAGHVLTSTSALSDAGGEAEMMNILSLIGNIEIEVVEVGYDGAGTTASRVTPPTAVPQGAGQ